ncbi:hypothetical protein [Yoonia sp. SS1-5]|uniref:Uncharacterized protein n=1 Tax=Yoonia rhodophyticola TaxID=3137370 RepID=A0AAN0MB47_9RHOB
MTLDAALLDAHARNDRRALVTLYAQAADAAPDLDASCFFLTQAYIFALEQAHEATGALHDRLQRHGRL